MYTTCTVWYHLYVLLFVCVCESCSKATAFPYFGTTICGPSSKVIPKPSTMASETHPSSFKQLSYTQTYCPTIQDGNPISCQSRHGPRICYRHITVQKSVVNALQPEFGHRPITAQESVCFLGRTSKSRSRASDVLFFMQNSEPHEYFLRSVHKQFIHIIFRKFIFIRRVRNVASQETGI